MKNILIGLILLAGSVPAWSAVQTVTLSIPGMSCPTCPITIKRALLKVPGVLEVSSNLEKRQSTVTFDDGKTSAQALTDATEFAGYPSTVLRPAKP